MAGIRRQMTLSSFLNVAFAILVAEHQRLGADLFTAMERVQELGEQNVASPPAPLRQNEQSMSQLKSDAGRGARGTTLSEFIAEALVRIVPDTTLFRAQLEAQLAKATATPVVVPVIAAAGRGAADVNRITQEIGLASSQAAAGTGRLATAQNAAAIAAQKLATAQSEVIGAASAAGAAQITLARSSAAVLAAETALNRALLTTDVALKNTTTDTLVLARAQQVQAAAALNSARANVGQARSLAGVSSGAASAGLALVGLRGATLAASAPFLAGAAAAITFSKAIGSAAALEENLNVFAAAAEATESEMAEVSERAVQLGSDITLPGVAATDAAEAMTTLAKAGLDTRDAMDAARGTLQLATAAEIDNAAAAQLAASALNSFGLSGEQASVVADSLASAANASQASLEDMGLALSQSAAVARQVGFSLTDTVALLTLLARNGLKGSDAGTSLRTALIRLINPTERASAEIAKLNLDLRDTAGNIRPDVFAQFANATRDLTRAERDRISALIFGQDAIRAQAILAREGTEGLREATLVAERQGEAQRIAAARTEGFTGTLEAFKNSVATLGISIGRFLQPGAENFLRFGTAVVSGINQATGAVEGSFEIIQRFNTLISTPPDFSGTTEELARSLGEASALADQFLAQTGRVPELLTKLIEDLTNALENELGPGFERPQEGAFALEQTLKALAETMGETTTEALKLASASSRLGRDIAVAQATGDEGGELSGLQERERRQQEFLERILSRPQTQANVDLATKAAENLDKTRREIQSILDKNATDARTARDEAQRSLDEADQNFLSAFAAGRERAGLRVAAAEQTAGVADDIKFQNQLQALIKQQIAKVRDLIKDEKVRAATILDLRRALIESQNAEQALRDERRKAREDERRSRQEELTRGVELDVELADINENTKRQIRSRLQLIKRLQQEAKALDLHGNALKENRNKRARLRQEIKIFWTKAKRTRTSASRSTSGSCSRRKGSPPRSCRTSSRPLPQQGRWRDPGFRRRGQGLLPGSAGRRPLPPAATCPSPEARGTRRTRSCAISSRPWRR